MRTEGRILTLLSAMLLLGLLLVFTQKVVAHSFDNQTSIPLVVAPEPYPDSDIYPAQVYLKSEQDLQVLYQLDIDIAGLKLADGISLPDASTFKPSTATIYIDPAQSEALEQAGLNPVPIANEGYRSFLAHGPGSGAPNAWPTFAEYVTRMQNLANAHPDLVQLVQIGTSVQGRGLYCMEVTDNPGVDENEPEFKYTANHHGDETTGVEMTMRLAELLVNSYGTDPVITDMVDKMETWLCPIYNPDGYTLGTRYNAHGVDLNRDFPDRFTDPIDDPAGREPETQAFMNFGYAHRFVMGANYHGGEQVLNYPFDAVADPYHPINAPDDQLFFDFGYGYTSRNSDLWNGGWPYGMTRGWQWYMIYGGMQDWAYYYHDEHHVTLEISWNKSPDFSSMDGFWDRNREAMLWWMQRAMTGIGGVVLDARDNTPLEAVITLAGRDMPNFVNTDPQVGDYHRVISEGSYTIEAASDGYLAQSSLVMVYSDTLSSHDFYLCPDVPWTVSGEITDAVSGNPLQANIEFVGSPQRTNSDPESGEYSTLVCPSTYTMHVSSPWHFSQDRIVEVNSDQTQNFALDPTPNLTPSTKSSSITQALPQESLEYYLRVENMGLASNVNVTDTLPISLTWSGYLTASQGIPSFENGQILWQGDVAPSQPVTITYGVTVSPCLSSGADILNIAMFSDHVNGIITGKVQLEILNASPSNPASPFPANGAESVPITTTLAWMGSSDLNCDPISYTLLFGTDNPPTTPVELNTPAYDPGVLDEGATYYWYVIAKDGQTEVAGPVWTFSTKNSPPSELLKIFLPLTRK